MMAIMDTNDDDMAAVQIKSCLHILTPHPLCWLTCILQHRDM